MYLIIRPDHEEDRHCKKGSSKYSPLFLIWLHSMFVGYSHFGGNTWHTSEINLHYSLHGVHHGFQYFYVDNGYCWFNNSWMMLNVCENTEFYKWYVGNGDTTYDEILEWFVKNKPVALSEAGVDGADAHFAMKRVIPEYGIRVRDPRDSRSWIGHNRY